MTNLDENELVQEHATAHVGDGDAGHDDQTADPGQGVSGLAALWEGENVHVALSPCLEDQTIGICWSPDHGLVGSARSEWIDRSTNERQLGIGSSEPFHHLLVCQEVSHTLKAKHGQSLTLQALAAHASGTIDGLGSRRGRYGSFPPDFMVSI